MVPYSEYEAGKLPKGTTKFGMYLVEVINESHINADVRFLLFEKVVREFATKVFRLTKDYDTLDAQFVLDSETYREDVDKFVDSVSDGGVIDYSVLLSYFSSMIDFDKVADTVKKIYDNSVEFLSKFNETYKDTINSDPLELMVNPDAFRGVVGTVLPAKTNDLLKVYFDPKMVAVAGDYTIIYLINLYQSKDLLSKLIKECGVDKVSRKVFSESDGIVLTASMILSKVIGLVMSSISDAHIMHFITSSYAVHMALQDYYESMSDKIDALGEYVQEVMTLSPEYLSVGISREECGGCPICYFEKLRDILTDYQKVCDGNSQLQSLYDDVLNEITELLYRLKNLH